MKFLSPAIAAALLLAGSASAQTPPAGPRPPPPPPAPAVPEALALEAAQTAVSTCTANGYKVGVSVVDSVGGLHVLVGAEGVRQGGLDSSTRKAFAASTLKAASSALDAQSKTDAALAAKIAAEPKMMARAGAVPILVGGAVVGAIGVGGAPGGEKDEVCAVAGLAKIKDRLK